MKLYRIVDKAKNYTSVWISNYSLIQSNLDGYRWCFDDYKDKDRIFVESVTNPRSQGCPRFQSGEELANNVGKINTHYSL